jgi:RimJ/RimL family protein N-acetyltransferase
VTKFDLQPTLRGVLVELRPLRADDFPTLYVVSSDRKIWEQHPSPDRYKYSVFAQYFTEAIASKGALLVRDLKKGSVIGATRFHAYDAVKREVEIGWTFLARSHWGGTYNHEMKQLMLRHAFQSVDRVLFVIGASNARSRKAVENIGAVLHGERAGADGEERVVYAITADAFAAGLGAQRTA